MMIVNDKPGRFFSSGGAEPNAALADGVDDMFADPEVCRRVGRIIAQGAQRRRGQGGPTPRRNGSDGSND